MDQQYFSNLLVKLVSKELRVAPESIQLDQQFMQFGLDSIAAVTISGELEDLIEQKLPTTLLWDYSTINALAYHLAKLVEDSTTAKTTE